jgi:hypothetical protein
MYVDIRSRPVTPFHPRGGSAPSSAAIVIFSGRTPILTCAPERNGARSDGRVTAVPPDSTTVVCPSRCSLISPSSRFEAPKNPATNSVSGDSYTASGGPSCSM